MPSLPQQYPYCVHSHTAAARAKGLTDAQFAEFRSVLRLAAQTNALANSLQIPIDPEFLIAKGREAKSARCQEHETSLSQRRSKEELMKAADPFSLERFMTAQKPVFDTAVAELRAGRKCSHWMWFIFPQLRGLGSSPMATRYAIGSLDEARAYLADPLLGHRLVLCTETVLTLKGKSPREIFGSPDDLKFRSSMTLFAQASADEDNIFRQALDDFYDGRPDERTFSLLAAAPH